MACRLSNMQEKSPRNFIFVTSTSYMDRSLGGQARFNGSISLTLLLFYTFFFLFERFVFYFSPLVFFLPYFTSNRYAYLGDRKDSVALFVRICYSILVDYKGNNSVLSL
ncbi:hypothetical protein LI328DRAFT_28155 [Trichoderma asperelloides]|nr:hypothetical protein LI328DRAFT_28155 [Trichoderma asperelloides]